MVYAVFTAFGDSDGYTQWELHRLCSKLSDARYYALTLVPNEVNDQNLATPGQRDIYLGDRDSCKDVTPINAWAGVVIERMDVM